METQTTFKQVFLAVLVLVIFLILLMGGAWATWKALMGLSPQVATAIVAGVATILVSVFSIIWSKLYERRKEIEQEQRQQKSPVYEEFLSLIFKVLLADKLGEGPVPEKELLKGMSAFAQKLMVWGSDEVLKEYSMWRRIAASSAAKENPVIHVFAIERLLLAIRKDVGHKNKNLRQGDLLAIFINDIEKFLQPQ
jgi:uncharacterized membrane protein (DUF485 family)